MNRDTNEANELPDTARVFARNTMTEEEWLAHCRKRYDEMVTFWGPIHAQAREDDKMVAGDQWDHRLKESRINKQRPCLTYNLLPAFSRQIVNKTRQDRPSIKATPVDVEIGDIPTVKNTSGKNDYSLSEVFSGIIKNIQYVSRADQAYDTALKHAVDHGFGYFYVLPVYSDVDPFVQDLQVFRVKDSYTVMLDPGAQEADYRDAEDGYIESRMNKSVFERKHPDIAPESFSPRALGSSYGEWVSTDDLRVAEYFWVEYEDDEVIRLSNDKTVYLSDVEDVLDEIKLNDGTHIKRFEDGSEMRRKVKRRRCMYQKMIATAVLEGPVELPFNAVPIFPVLGEEVIVDERITYEGAFRHALDPQRSYNYWRTAAAETVALAPRAPWVLTPKQLAGNEKFFENANSENTPYVLYNPDDRAPPPQRAFPSSVAAAELANSTQDSQDMQTIIGLHDASMGRESNEKSGKAILARQNQGSTATFQFPDNLERAQLQMGRLLVEAIPKLYDTERVARIRLEDNTEDFVQLNQSVYDDEGKKTVLINDIAYGKYDVVMDRSSYYATQEQEAADMQMELLKILPPEKASNIAHLIVQNLGMPGMSEVGRVLRKMIPDELKSEQEIDADLPRGVTRGEDGQLMKDGEQWKPPPTLDQQLAAQEQKLRELEANAEMEAAKSKRTKAESDSQIAEHRAKEQQFRLELQALKNDMARGEGGQQAQEADKLRDELVSIIDEQGENMAEQVAKAIADSLKRTKDYVDKVEQRLMRLHNTNSTGDSNATATN